MAQMLFKQGSFRILSDNVGILSANEMNELIRTAGTTCYQTRETSKKTPEEFIQMLQSRGHHAMLEHSWYTFRVSIVRSRPVIEDIALDLFLSNSLFCITMGYAAPELLISGNARMFLEGYKKTKGQVLGTILYQLHEENPVLFPVINGGFPFVSYVHLERNPTLGKDIRETLTHQAMTVEFNNHSRGFTHEDVRSRNGDEKITSYAQESTRYVDYAKGEVNVAGFQMKFILPYHDEFDFRQKIDFRVDGVHYSFTPQEFTNLMEGWYRALRTGGLRPEEARQWLPIGIKSQIVQTYNLREWRHWFHLRANAPAHPEIRWSAVNLLKEVQKRIPGVFDDFDFRFKNDGSEFAVYTGNDPLV